MPGARLVFFLRVGVVSMASQGPTISHPCPAAQPCPSAAELAQSPEDQGTVSTPPGTCFSLTALRINYGFPGNLLTFVSCVFNIGIRVLVTAFQNVLVQSTFSRVP